METSKIKQIPMKHTFSNYSWSFETEWNLFKKKRSYKWLTIDCKLDGDFLQLQFHYFVVYEFLFDLGPQQNPEDLNLKK